MVSTVFQILENSSNLCFPDLETFWKTIKYPKSFGKVMQIFNDYLNIDTLARCWKMTTMTIFLFPRNSLSYHLKKPDSDGCWETFWEIHVRVFLDFLNICQNKSIWQWLAGVIVTLQTNLVLITLGYLVIMAQKVEDTERLHLCNKFSMI